MFKQNIHYFEVLFGLIFIWMSHVLIFMSY